MANKVQKKILSNGLTILVVPRHNIPKVSLQLFYNVGSKDEESKEKGIAHLIEHMIFKGTKKLSESDINLITHKLSGYCNAFTSPDYTGYLFDLPTQNWREALPIMADCMRNCTFKEEFLNSELKAVIQELKMYNDNYPAMLIESMVASIFPDHPYHYPVIGYKQDLWSLDPQKLINFYRTHYVPNNATLIVVGDVEPEEVFKLAEQYFGEIPSDETYKKKSFYFHSELGSKAVTLYRHIKQPFYMLAWVVPGLESKKEYALDLLSWIIGSGKGSRLQKKLVYEYKLVTEVESFTYDLYDHGLFIIYFQPKNEKDVEKIIELINEELRAFASEGPTQAELIRARKKAESGYLNIFENNQKVAYLLGKLYLATNDENYLFQYIDSSVDAEEIKGLAATYLRPAVMHRGSVLPIEKSEERFWQLHQDQSDEEDSRILSGKKRQIPVEEGRYIKEIEVREPGAFSFPQAQKFVLPNGLTVLYYQNEEVPKIELSLDFKAKHYFDPDGKEGIGTFVANLLLEGTNKRSATELAEFFESHGMSIAMQAGAAAMSMLSSDLEKGLSLLTELYTESTFDEDSIEKIRSQILADLKIYWDDPNQFASQLVRDIVYKNHPYSKPTSGTVDSISSITREDVIEYAKKYLSPKETRIAVVGNLKGYNLENLFERTLGTWHGPEIKDLEFPRLQTLEKEEVNYPIKRDQIVLCFAGLSVSRFDHNYDKILIFDQIFTGGVLSAMSSRLFALREQSGLFYTIGGSLLANCDTQSGLVFIKTIVSSDRLTEAEEAIENLINHSSEYIYEEELSSARNAIINTLVDNFSSNRAMSNAFLFVDKYNLPADYFSTRASKILSIDGNEVLEAVKPILNTNKMVKIRIGRVKE